MIYYIVAYLITLNDPSQILRAHHYSTESISEMIQDRHSYNGILTGTYTCLNQQCKFK